MFGGVHLRRDARQAYGACHRVHDEPLRAAREGRRSMIAASAANIRPIEPVLSVSEVIAVRVGCVLGCTLFWTVVAKLVFGG